MLNITSGKIARAQKTVIYGPEGIGKTTLAAAHPDPLIIDTEGGTSHLDVRRIGKPQNWEELISIVKEVAQTPNVCKTLIIDTADWAEQIATIYICQKYRQASVESFGYGKGYTYLAEEFQRLLQACDMCIANGINVVITAHAKMRKFEQPDELGAYDRWELKLSKQTAPILKEWCDHLLFCNYKTDVMIADNGKAKAQGGKRVIYTAHHPAWDAKTRSDLPTMVDMSFEAISPIYSAPESKPTETAADKARKLIEASEYSEEDVLRIVHKKGHHKDINALDEIPENFITGFIIKYWEQIIDLLDKEGGANE